MTDMERKFILCERCGKRLIERQPNGLWHFCFGRDPNNPGNPPVDMLIHGNLQLKCLRRSCGHVNTLNYLPFSDQEEGSK